MERQSLISTEVLARYAEDAAREVDGVAGVDDGGGLHRHGVLVSGDAAAPAVRLRIELDWGRNAAEVGSEVQRRVAEYLGRMADLTPASVEVLVSGVGAPPAKR